MRACVGRGLVAVTPVFRSSNFRLFCDSPTGARSQAEEMAMKLSDLEMAINSLVTHFHGSASDGSTLNTTEFQTMITKQLPTFAKTMEGDDGLEKVLKMMEVENGQNITFDKFWGLVHNQAVHAFNSTYKEPDTKCNCSLQ